MATDRRGVGIDVIMLANHQEEEVSQVDHMEEMFGPASHGRATSILDSASSTNHMRMATLIMEKQNPQALAFQGLREVMR